MISFDEALSLIACHPLQLLEHTIPTTDALGHYLSQDLCASIDLPSFDNSAVDGFAVRCEDLAHKNWLSVNQTIRARRQERSFLPPHHAAKVMTGAPLPQGADAVIMKEVAQQAGAMVYFDQRPKVNQNIRFCGEDISKGTRVVEQGSLITPQLTGLLLGLGIAQCKVFAKARIRIIATGDELVSAPAPLHHGEVYCLVGPMLRAQCHEIGLKDVDLVLLPDDKALIEQAISDALDAELVLICGGMSKGDHDMVLPALKHLGIEQIFYQGRWRPGKPLYFGRSGNTRLFGLPGNPVAAFMCFRIFVRELLSHAYKAPTLSASKTAILAHDVEKKLDFSTFARAELNERNELFLLDKQGSHHLSTLVKANALCHLPSGHAIVKANEAVKYYAL